MLSILNMEIMRPRLQIHEIFANIVNVIIYAQARYTFS